ncbi:hypothetical protein ACOSP7_028079 [Xanthoceras sorbifolium]
MKMDNANDRDTRDNAKANLGNMVQGGMKNKSRGGVSIPKKAGNGNASSNRFKNKGTRFNMLEEQLDEVLEADNIECPDENLNISALKDVTNIAGKGGRRGKGTVVGAGTGGGGKGVVGKVLAHNTSKVLKGKMPDEGAPMYNGGKQHNNFQKILYKQIDNYKETE